MGRNIQTYRVLFWDFDGVIKDSVDVKTEAYVRLFSSFGRDLAEKVREHHLRNGGISRFEKIPIYMEWAGIPANQEEASRYCDKFSELVFEAVIASPWIPGVVTYLSENSNNQDFFLVTATPQDEIMKIIKALDIGKYFKGIAGAPVKKADAIRNFLSSMVAKPFDCCMIGDSIQDFQAAEQNEIDFIYRTERQNSKINLKMQSNMLADFQNV